MIMRCVISCFLGVVVFLWAFVGAIDDPIILLGLPKSGTTSFTFLFHRLRFKSAHYISDPRLGECADIVYPIPKVTLANGVEWSEKVWRPMLKSNCFYAHQIQYALSQGLPPLHYLVDVYNYTGFTQLDCGGCDVYPQLDALHEIATSYPKAFFIHNIRNITAHVNSIVAWAGGGYAHHLQLSGMLSKYPGQDEANSVPQNIEALIRHSRNTVRSFFSKRDDLRFLEIDISTTENATQKLFNFLELDDVKVPEHMPHRNKNMLKVASTNRI